LTDSLVQKLTAAYPDITEVWLIGSPATGSARPDSDWDYLAFGNRLVLNSLRQRREFNLPNVDLLIVHDGNRFAKPWRDNAGVKAGSLRDWEWRVISDDEAAYRATKFRDDGDFNRNISVGRGRRVWPNR
jgi:predicted nucleotidyltransferase